MKMVGSTACSAPKGATLKPRRTTKAWPLQPVVLPAQKTCLTWERLADLKTNSPQQRNVVLHPEFVDGKYALYTRPQDGFISAGKGGGIGFGLCDSMENAVLMKKHHR
jgi:predicted GH43/DUF377 family glycosyl hydrolase